jgi:transposase
MLGESPARSFNPGVSEPVRQHDPRTVQEPPTVAPTRESTQNRIFCSSVRPVTPKGNDMQVVTEICAGLDVHARTIVACLNRHGQKEIRTFATMSDDLLRLLDWLVTAGCTQVVVESTGVYWQPAYHLLESQMEVLLVNARHVKAVPGRKTDVKDCEWLADLLRHGLLRGSFIPPAPIREVRELVRYRATLVRERASVTNRIQKLIESANIKLAQVASDALGVSGLAMLRALAAGKDDPDQLVALAHGRLKAKAPELRRAVQGHLTAAQRWVLGELLTQYDDLTAAQGRVAVRLQTELEASTDPFVAAAVERLDTIPGVGTEIAQTIVAEIGTDMTRFPSDRHLASWAGLCPGNHQSAGQRLSGRIRHGNHHLRTALVQAAWAATRTKHTYLAAQYQRLVKRKGKQKALVAVAHSILVMVYHILQRQENYHELGGDYFDRQESHKQQQRLLRQLQALGLQVTVTPA